MHVAEEEIGVAAEGPRIGAYGLALSDGDPGRPLVRSAAEWLVPAEPGWPGWEIVVDASTQRSVAADGAVDEEYGPDRAVLRAEPDGVIEIDRVAGRSLLRLPRPPSPESLVHPYLGSTAAVAGHWFGRSTFHAGGVVVDGGVWGLLGGREAGKSSALMGLHRVGLGIMCDDLLVVGGGGAYAGPRCLDLRRATAEHFGEGRLLGRVGRRERWRVGLPDVAGHLPLRGWVELTWSDDIGIEIQAAGRRLRVLAGNRALVVPGAHSEAFLDLASKPVYRFSRPRSWDHLERGLERLTEELGRE